LSLYIADVDEGYMDLWGQPFVIGSLIWSDQDSPVTSLLCGRAIWARAWKRLWNEHTASTNSDHVPTTEPDEASHYRLTRAGWSICSHQVVSLFNDNMCATCDLIMGIQYLTNNGRSHAEELLKHKSWR
jgi:hypothetical protein